MNAIGKIFCCLCALAIAPARADVVQWVDPHIGTADHGHVFVGASVPFGMVQLGPTSVPQAWDWCSGYHLSDSTVIGFSHTHLSGTGIGDLFDVTVMPVVGDAEYARGSVADPATGLWSAADRTQEVAEPGFYSVPLDRYGVLAELTATNRVGLHRYTFPASDSAAIVIDLQNGGCWDRPVSTGFVVESPTRISGWRQSTGWARDQKVYFAAEFSKPMAAFSQHGENGMYGRADFATADGEQLLLKVAISPVSIEGAKRNLAAEAPGWDFDQARQDARQAWEDELGRVKIEAQSHDDYVKFYTALYHTMISPSTFCDVDGQYRGADGEVYAAEGFVPYTIFSLWDTYRAAMPLMSIIEPERFADFTNTMIDIAEKQGRLPVWHLWGNETDCMVGNPGVVAVADAVAKGTPGVDPRRAMDAMLKTVADTARGLGVRARYGFIPADLHSEAVACDMEYAIADAALVAAAKTMGLNELADSFECRSHSWRQYFDPSTHFVRGRLADGSWREPFDPVFAKYGGEADFTEGNAWQYTWLVPHDVDGLVEQFGSKEALISRLDSLFLVSSELNEGASPDISGMIGQYAHGNEPGHHTAYLYAMLGEPEKTADLVRRILEEMYSTEPRGLCGNEDAGQMSAWLVLSALGLYEVEPAGARYWFGSPIVDSAEIALPGGILTIQTVNNSPENRYLRSVSLNGEPYHLPYLPHSAIAPGGVLVFEMGPTTRSLR